jgi:hypothetical protein
MLGKLGILLNIASLANEGLSPLLKKGIRFGCEPLVHHEIRIPARAAAFAFHGKATNPAPLRM